MPRQGCTKTLIHPHWREGWTCTTLRGSFAPRELASIAHGTGMPAEAFMGIDGGASKTAGVLLDATGRLLASSRAGARLMGSSPSVANPPPALYPCAHNKTGDTS